METGLFEIQSGHLRDYRQSRQLLPDSRDIIHTVFGRADSAGAHAVSHSAVGKMEPLPNSRKTPPIPMSNSRPISRSIVSVAMKLPYGARPAGFYMRSRRLIAASQKSECAAFGLRATTELSRNNPRLLVRPNSQNINAEAVKTLLQVDPTYAAAQADHADQGHAFAGAACTWRS